MSRLITILGLIAVFSIILPVHAFEILLGENTFTIPTDDHISVEDYQALENFRLSVKNARGTIHIRPALSKEFSLKADARRVGNDILRVNVSRTTNQIFVSVTYPPLSRVEKRHSGRKASPLLLASVPEKDCVKDDIKSSPQRIAQEETFSRVNLTLYVPSELLSRLEAETYSGDVSVESINDPEDRKFSLKTYSGKISVWDSSASHGLTLTSFSGSIDVLRTTGNITAKTNSGPITLGQNGGFMTFAESKSGDIKIVEQSGSHVEANSKRGSTSLENLHLD